MATPIDVAPSSDRELVLARVIDAPRHSVYRCWTEPALITQWFTPPPWTTPKAELDVRPGGSSLITMQKPDGTLLPSPGLYLDVVPDERLVFTDAYASAWEPSEKAFMTVELTFADEGTGTRYIARVRHWSVEDAAAHEQMEFHEGWGIATDQLEAVARTL